MLYELKFKKKLIWKIVFLLLIFLLLMIVFVFFVVMVMFGNKYEEIFDVIGKFVKEVE